ncbi:MAG: glycosyltransferase family 2 protein [Flavobacteriales bacterium]|nr:glycosyltransferase family 2 protein [Flavobacteriales bacterium]
MLSILIPIYNRDCTKLVTDLHKEGEAAAFEFELICLDDCSSDEFQLVNRQLKTLPNVIYTELEENTGRSRIRNKLAEKAKYDTLLFIDCDMAVSSGQFLQKYIAAVDGPGAIVGGLAYDPVVPDNFEHRLRWTYGHERESISVKQRQKHPYASFMTGTFAIDKESFNSIKFDESIQRYGHEDTLFGKELFSRGIKVIHIDNPLLHRGLEPKADFIAKTEQAVETLAELVKAGKLKDEVKLYRVYQLLKRFYLHNLIAIRFRKRKDAWLGNLHSTKPDLKYFDMYRLGYLCTLMQK